MSAKPAELVSVGDYLLLLQSPSEVTEAVAEFSTQGWEVESSDGPNDEGLMFVVMRRTSH